jgi:hypothetical protein
VAKAAAAEKDAADKVTERPLLKTVQLPLLKTVMLVLLTTSLTSTCSKRPQEIRNAEEAVVAEPLPWYDGHHALLLIQPQVYY